MKTRQITPNLIQLTRLGLVNAYLVREEDGFTLVDTTVGGGAKQLIAAARDAGGEIRRIVLTHAHSDHIGSLDALKDELGDGVEVRIPELDVRVLHGEKVHNGKKVKGGWPKVRTAPDGNLPAGERIGSLEVVPSPGHTPGHVSFLDTRDRALIAGDAYITAGGAAVPSHFRTRFPLATLGSWDRVTVLASARLLRELDPSTLVTGHGPAIERPAAAMDRAIETAERAAG